MELKDFSHIGNSGDALALLEQVRRGDTRNLSPLASLFIEPKDKIVPDEGAEIDAVLALKFTPRFIFFYDDPFFYADTVKDIKNHFLAVVQAVREKTNVGNTLKNFFPLVKPFFSDQLISLLVSESLDEFIKGIHVICGYVGRSKFFLAVLLFVLHDNWKNYKKKFGIKSWTAFINSFPDKYRMSRQAVYNAISVGKLLVYIAECIPSQYSAERFNSISAPQEKGYHVDLEPFINIYCGYNDLADYIGVEGFDALFCAIRPMKGYDIDICDFFKCSYKKLTYAAKLLKKGNKSFPSSLKLSVFLPHLKQDDYDDFKNFIDSHIKKKKPRTLSDDFRNIFRDINKDKDAYKDEHNLDGPQSEFVTVDGIRTERFLKDTERQIYLKYKEIYISAPTYDPSMFDETEKKIFQEAAKGRITYFLKGWNDDPYIIPYIKKSLYTLYNKREKEYSTPDVDIISFDDSNILPNDIYSFIVRIVKADSIKPEYLRYLMSTEIVNLIQLRIIQAYIVYRIIRDPAIRDKFLQSESEKYLSPREIAKKYLDINNSTLKMLLRISGNLRYIPKLYEAGIDPITEGSVDKIANFGLAVTKYGLPKAIEAFRCCSTVKEFRHFIRTGQIPYDLYLNDKKLFRKIFKRARPFLAIYAENRYFCRTVYPLYLYSHYDIKLVKKYETEYFIKRKQAIKEIMCPSVPLLPYKTNTQPP